MCIPQGQYVKITRSGLSFLFSYSHFHFFIFRTLGLGLEWWLVTPSHQSHLMVWSQHWSQDTRERSRMLSSQMVDLVFFYFTFYFYFHSILFFYFLSLEHLGLGLISHTVTLITTWWHSHKTDHKTWENLVEDLRTDDIIQYEHHMLASWTTHGCLG